MNIDARAFSHSGLLSCEDTTFAPEIGTPLPVQSTCRSGAFWQAITMTLVATSRAMLRFMSASVVDDSALLRSFIPLRQHGPVPNFPATPRVVLTRCSHRAPGLL